ncbi:MAG: sodium:solute symporter family protein, partial [Candidatus Helarchaeota archaeon]|nr:sodium:solute symporter family protein [Candidatus Helarchaeota archaeon]
MGGRAFGKVFQTFAAFGTGTTADSPISTARNTFIGGISGIWTSLNWLFCTPFYWLYGVWYRRMRYITLGDLFEERYNSKGLGAFYAVYGIVFFMVYLSLGFSAIQKTVTAITPKPEYELTVQEKCEYESFKRL